MDRLQLYSWVTIAIVAPSRGPARAAGPRGAGDAAGRVAGGLAAGAAHPHLHQHLPEPHRRQVRHNSHTNTCALLCVKIEERFTFADLLFVEMNAKTCAP